VRSVHGEVCGGDCETRRSLPLESIVIIYDTKNIDKTQPSCAIVLSDKVFFFFGESFKLGEEKRSNCARSFWGRRSRRKQNRKKSFRLESISEEEPAKAAGTDSSWRMWDVVTMPGKLGDALGYLVRYATQSIDYLLCPM
jgi:hypothetical protein